MDKFNLIRSGIFFVGGLVTILFRKQLNNIKNNLFEKFGIKRKDERKTYVYFGIIFFIISLILLVYSITH